MKDQFIKKEAHLKKISEQLEVNNQFICAHAEDVQAILDEHRNAIIDEKNIEHTKLKNAQEAWNREIEAVKKKNNFEQTILTLDIGGR